MEEAAQEDDRLSLIAPVGEYTRAPIWRLTEFPFRTGYSQSTCGYCTPSGSGTRSSSKTSKSYGIWAYQITPAAYQALLNRGWRRSGAYIYRPDNAYEGTCCPQVGVRVRVDEFVPHKNQRHALSSLQRLLRTPHKRDRHSHALAPALASRAKGKYALAYDLEAEWSSLEYEDKDAHPAQSDAGNSKPWHLADYHTRRAMQAHRHRKGQASAIRPARPPRTRKVETRLTLADDADEKYQLFRKYQHIVHGEHPDKISSKKGYERFLCSAPLMSTLPGSSHVQNTLRPGDTVDVATSDPIPYDLYHMEWRLDGTLIAVGVLDILPTSVSSVYLFYDPDYAELQLGTVSALREIVLVRQLQRKRNMDRIRYYNMGLYIHECPKMRYKARFGPAQLLDPLTCEWVNLADVHTHLDRGVRYDYLRTSHKPAGKEEAANTHTRDKRREDGSEDDNDDHNNNDPDDDDDDDDDMRPLPRPLPPGMTDMTEDRLDTLARTFVFDNGRVQLLAVSP